MTEKDRELQSLRRELDWLMQSKAIRSMAEKDESGNHKNNIRGLDTCIQTLPARARAAEARQKTLETEAQTLRAENICLRRRIEALVDNPSPSLVTAIPVPAADTSDERNWPLYG